MDGGNIPCNPLPLGAKFPDTATSLKNSPSLGGLVDDHLEKYPVKLAQVLEGWMTVPELAWLARTAADRRFIIEVGSWKGRSTKALATATSGVVYAVDHWIDTCVFAVFMRNLDSEIAQGRVVPIHKGSIEAIPVLEDLLQGRKADMVFIDGDHSYEAVRRDILAYRPLLSPGGILSGHDYPRAGVGRAVDELIQGFSTHESIWYVQV